MATDYSDTTIPLTAAVAAEADKSGAPPVINRFGLFKRVYALQEGVAALEAVAPEGVYAFTALDYTDNPTAADTLVIGDDTYEFVATGGDVTTNTNIGVVREATAAATFANLVLAINSAYASNLHAYLFQDDSTTPAIANGTENVLASITSGVLYLYAADAPGGTKVAGAAPDLAVTAAGLTEAIEFVPTNLNLSVGAGAAVATQAAHLKHTVVAGNLTAAQPLKLAVPFTPQSWNVQVRDAAGMLKPDAYAAVTVPAAVGGQDYLGLNLVPTAPTSLKRAILHIPVTASASTYAHLNLPTGIVPVSYKFVRGAAAAGTCTVALDRITKSSGAVATALSTAVSVAGGSTDAEQTFTPTTAVSGTNHACTAAQGLKVTIAAGAGASPPPITFIVEYYENVIATDVLHVSVFG